uniref:Hexosyltransferase n=1 Tax=Periophthalmus magnuspinnatus TaxID=409849 RepID=A0A3B4AR89_9GOBI
MVLLTSLFLIFLSTLHLEKTHSHSLEQKELRRPRIIQAAEKLNATVSPLTKHVSFPTVKPDVSVSVSSGLTQAISKNKAYWNRLLYSTLRQVNRKELEHHHLWSHCREVNQELLKTNIHDFASYPYMFQDFLMAMNCKSPPLLVNQPDKCLNSDRGGQTFLLFAIKSRPGNFEQRHSVRETWGREEVFQNNLRVRTLFLLGSPSSDDPDLGALFGDDDVFVNTPALLSYLQSLEPSKATQLFVGHVISTAAPLRDPKSKYYIPLSFYDGTYPPYIGGGGFAVSGSLLQRLHSISRVIPFFPIDDVYIAMCLKALGISPEAHSGFQTFDVSEQDRQNLCVHKGLILIHQRSPRELKKLWRGIHSPLLTC